MSVVLIMTHNFFSKNRLGLLYIRARQSFFLYFSYTATVTEMEIKTNIEGLK